VVRLGVPPPLSRVKASLGPAAEPTEEACLAWVRVASAFVDPSHSASGTTPDISVLLVNWNTRDLVLRCLDSLPQGIGRELTFETIVVDNGSSDGSADALRSRSDIVLLANRMNFGYAAAVNQAYRSSRGPLLLLLNSDVELLPGSIAVLEKLLARHSDAAAAAPLYRYPDGSPQPFHFRFPSFAVTLANTSAPFRHLPGVKQRLRDYAMLDDDFSEPRPVEQPSTSCLLLRRSCLPFDNVFDERFPIFFNDVSLAQALANQGRQLWVTPDAVVVHEDHASTRKLGTTRKRQYIASVVRMLRDTEPRRNVLLYKALLLAQGVVLLGLRRPDALSWRDLTAAASGDPGVLPSQPVAET
jgi:GT2 family glycosyltransferase